MYASVAAAQAEKCARAVERRAKEAAELMSRVTITDALCDLRPDETELLAELCGGEWESLEVETCRMHLATLAMRCGRMFDAAEVDDALRRAAQLSAAERILVSDLLATLREKPQQVYV